MIRRLFELLAWLARSSVPLAKLVFRFTRGRPGRVALSAAVDAAPTLAHLREIRFVLWSEDDLDAFRAALRALADRTR